MAMSRTICLAILLASFALPVQSLDISADKNRPVSKVVTILKDMLKTLQAEAEADEDIYDKLACWCDTNEKEKTKAIAVAEKKIAHLESLVEELTANSASLTEEIENLEKEKKANEEALDKATALRRKDLADFNEEEKEMIESITALNAAIAVLSKHHSSLLQMPPSHLKGVAASIQNVLAKNTKLLDGVLTRAEKQAIATFAQQTPTGVVYGDKFSPPATQNPSYSAASGQIFGILTTMKETFERDLAASQKEDKDGQTSYDDLKAAKDGQIAAGTDQIASKKEALAESNSKIAEANEDMADTKASLSADEEFLAMLQDKCATTDAEWEERQKTRAGEMESVSKALAILNTDEAHDLFTKTFNAAFVQSSSLRHSARQVQASKVVAAVAQKMHNPRLATLAVTIRLDAFTRVKKAIDDMVAQLTKEKTDEISHKDWCVKEFQDNEMETTAKENLKTDTNAEIEDLESTIETLTGEIDELTKDMAEMQKEIKIAGQNREKANKEFQVIIADQRETQKVLSTALKVLKDWYAKGSFVQSQQPAGPPPPPGFSEYKDNKDSNPVMKLLETIIADTKSMEAETIRAEEDAQKAYEDFVMDTNTGLEAKAKETTNKKATKAKKEEANVQAGKALDDVTLELEQLSNFNGELHTSCDYIMKNFEIRQTARDEEIEALKQAKAILSGAKFAEMLQEE